MMIIIMNLTIMRCPCPVMIRWELLQATAAIHKLVQVTDRISAAYDLSKSRMRTLGLLHRAFRGWCHHTFISVRAKQRMQVFGAVGHTCMSDAACRLLRFGCSSTTFDRPLPRNPPLSVQSLGTKRSSCRGRFFGSGSVWRCRWEAETSSLLTAAS